jgi:hypothetical protein
MSKWIVRLLVDSSHRMSGGGVALPVTVHNGWALGVAQCGLRPGSCAAGGPTHILFALGCVHSRLPSDGPLAVGSVAMQVADGCVHGRGVV